MPPVDGLDHAADPPLARSGPAAQRTREDRELAAEHLDLEAGRLGVSVLDDAEIAGLLESTRRIAVIGASADPGRPSHGVLLGLRAAGYDVVPVNPSEAEVAGMRCYATLAEAVAATGPVDIVDVFRRHDACPGHAREAVAAGARCLWLQLGLVSREAGLIAHEAGLAVVMNRCTLIELERIRRA
jgi:predicted CoA-binding protein